MVEAYLGEIRIFAGNFAPKGWAFCEGQLLPIEKYKALFSLLGVTYGGDGRTTFALPDLRGRLPVGSGAGPGLPRRFLGENTGGHEVMSARGPDFSFYHRADLAVNFIIALEGVYPDRS